MYEYSWRPTAYDKASWFITSLLLLVPLLISCGRHEAPPTTELRRSAAVQETALPIAAVTASADDGNGPANTIDGNLGTRWSVNGVGHSITYDLGALVGVGSVAIAFYKGEQRFQYFRIDVSSDGAQWANVYVGQSSGRGLTLETFGFITTTARFVRLVGGGNSKDPWNSLTEVKIFAGESSAMTRLIEAESVTGTGWTSVQRTGAFGGRAMLASQKSMDAAPGGDPLSYAFSLSAKSTVAIWLRVVTADDASDSLYLRVPSVGPAWTTLSGGWSRRSTWYWRKCATLSLDEGTHRLEIKFRESGLLLDQILVTSDPSSTPGGGSPTAPPLPLPTATSPTMPATPTTPLPTATPTKVPPPTVPTATPLPPTATPSPSTPPSGSPLPSAILDLRPWKLTLPIGSPDEISQPKLATYAHGTHFRVNDAGNAVLFRAHTGGATTSNSGYPRSELREMSYTGSDPKASWSSTTGTHTMRIRQAITHTPKVKPHVVAGQIHDAEDDIIMIRYEGNAVEKLFVESDGKAIATLDANYQVGTIFDVEIVASAGRIKVYYNGVLKLDKAFAKTGLYFKAGVYTQSNETTEKGDTTAYGEVAIHELTVTHR